MILQLSGIGNRTLLDEAKIRLVSENPHVGQNITYHQYLTINFTRLGQISNF